MPRRVEGGRRRKLRRGDGASSGGGHLRHAVGDLSHLRTPGVSLSWGGTQARTALAGQLPGRAGQDHRLLRAESGRASYAARGGGLAATAAVFEGTSRVKQATQFPARPRGRRVMKRWLSLVLAGLGVCLLLALGHGAAGTGADSRPCLARWGCVSSWGDPALPSPSATHARKATTPGPAPNAPLESRVVHLELLTERDLGRLWLDSRGPPGKVRGSLVDSRVADQTGSPKQGESMLSPTRSKHP